MLEAQTVTFEYVTGIADGLKKKTKHRPTVLIIAGSGLGHLADEVEDAEIIPYGDIPGFAVSTVSGHSGELVFGNLGGKVVVVMKGRVHMYEGYPLVRTTLPIRVVRQMGVEIMIVTNAAGSIKEGLSKGDIMLITDHINFPGFSGFTALRGPNDEQFGTRFPATNRAYSPRLKKVARAGAAELELTGFQEGCYGFVCGPSYETPAEIRMLKTVGVDAIGMSTVPEVIVAIHCGIECVGLTLVTNVCIHEVDADHEPTHDEVKDMANERGPVVRALVAYIIKNC